MREDLAEGPPDPATTALRLTTNTVNLAVAIAFATMGGFVIYLAGTKTMTSGPGSQPAIGQWLSRQFEHLQQWLAPYPNPYSGCSSRQSP